MLLIGWSVSNSIQIQQLSIRWMATKLTKLVERVELENEIRKRN